MATDMIRAVQTATRELLGEGEVRLEVRPLLGGLENGAVHWAAARHRSADGRERTRSFVVKELAGDGRREAAVYQQIVAAHAVDFAPKFFGASRTGPDRAVLLLEAVRGSSWPWRDGRAHQCVLERLARLHASSLDPRALPPWDYEAELRASADSTLELLERARRSPELAPAARFFPALRRVTERLPQLRRALLEDRLLPVGLLHGDVHPGNVLTRWRRRGWAPVFIDWSRARLGSPLEDVSSWLQSLRPLETEALRQHDALLSRYLELRVGSPRLSPAIREAYWLAGASNALAGALRYHVAIAANPSRPAGERLAAAASARDWLRIVFRADALWR